MLKKGKYIENEIIKDIIYSHKNSNLWGEDYSIQYFIYKIYYSNRWKIFYEHW
jgi:hypothetical protein